MNKKDKHNNYGKLVAAAENGALRKREREREGGRPITIQMSLNRRITTRSVLLLRVENVRKSKAKRNVGLFLTWKLTEGHPSDLNSIVDRFRI